MHSLQKQIKKIVLKKLYEQDNIGQQNMQPQQQAQGATQAELPDFNTMGDKNNTDNADNIEVVSPDSMIKLFNAIRSGQSMKSDDVTSKLKEWWKTNEKKELKKFLFMLANVAKIVSEKNDEIESDTTDAIPEQPAPEQMQPMPQAQKQPQQSQQAAPKIRSV